MIFVLLRREIEQIVRKQIQNEPYSNNYRKHDKACAVVNDRKKREQKNPEDGIISLPNKGEWVSERLFDENVVS